MDMSNPYVQAAQQVGDTNKANAQAATAANRVNQNTAYGSLNYSQTGTDQYGNPTYTANQSLSAPLQGTFNNLTNNLAQTSGQGPFNAIPYNAQQSNGYTGMQGWDKATALINQRLQPQMAQSSESQNAALANQGIVPGTQAYENAMRTFNQGQNDLLTNAQLAGSQVQNQMQSQSLAQQQANNSALGQNYAQNYQAYNNPLQQLGSFNQGTQAGYVNPYSQATVASPDYLGAYTTGQAADIAKQNAANAQSAGNTAGLYNLGSSALLGSGGVGGLFNLGSQAYNGISGLFGSSPSSYWTNPSSAGSFGGDIFSL